MSGWLHVITGPMYSGKSDALISKLRRRTYANKYVLAFSPRDDTRSDFYIESRTGATYTAYKIKEAQEIINLYEVFSEPEVVGIDEAQFFGPEIVDVVRALLSRGVNVIVAGLDRDFNGNAFGAMAELLVEADEVDKLTAVCFACGADASLTQRLIDGFPAPASAPIVVIEGDATYEARCRNCWRRGE